MWFPGSRGHIQTASTSSRRIRRQPTPHHQDHPEVLERKHGGILDLGRLAAIFAGTESSGFFYQELFAGEGSTLER
jgi:hypothetical protein